MRDGRREILSVDYPAKQKAEEIKERGFIRSSLSNIIKCDKMGSQKAVQVRRLSVWISDGTDEWLTADMLMNRIH
jgi:hypothetical protein